MGELVITRFWMVLREDSSLSSIRHATEELAKVEASRLSRKHLGIRFHVLASIGYSQTVTTLWVDTVTGG